MVSQGRGGSRSLSGVSSGHQGGSCGLLWHFFVVTEEGQVVSQKDYRRF